jgi:hypothetical protein
MIMTKTLTKISTRHATPGELAEQAHLMDPLDFDGCPLQRLAVAPQTAAPNEDAAQEPQDAASEPPSTSLVRGHRPSPARPADGHTADRRCGS